MYLNALMPTHAAPSRPHRETEIEYFTRLAHQRTLEQRRDRRRRIVARLTGRRPERRAG
jgi:hypothetical protein